MGWARSRKIRRKRKKVCVRSYRDVVGVIPYFVERHAGVRLLPAVLFGVVRALQPDGGLHAHFEEPRHPVDGDEDEDGRDEHPRLEVVALLEERDAHGEVALERQRHCRVARPGECDLGHRHRVREGVHDDVSCNEQILKGLLLWFVMTLSLQEGDEVQFML